jgi:hypothetical protein
VAGKYGIEVEMACVFEGLLKTAAFVLDPVFDSLILGIASQ